MKKAFLLVILAGMFFGTSSEVSAKFRLWEVRAMAGMSITTVSQYGVKPFEGGPGSLITTSDKDVRGIPFGLRFILASGTEGFALGINGYFQPVISDDDQAEYLVTPSIVGSGSLERSYWDAGVSAELMYRFPKNFLGLYVGGGVGLHRVADKTSLNPPLYLTADYPFPLEELDNSDFRSGIHLFAGIPIHTRFALEGRYEKINDFNQVKIGVSVALWLFE